MTEAATRFIEDTASNRSLPVSTWAFDELSVITPMGIWLASRSATAGAPPL
jgi:hypothetical protein